MYQKLSLMFNDNKVFPVLYDLKYSDDVLKSSSNVVILGRVLNIMNLKRITDFFKSNNKIVLVDLDLIRGLSDDEFAVKYLSKKVGVDGVITTRASKIVEIKKENLISILKVFCYDEFSLQSAIKNITYSSPDILEVLPAVAAPFFVEEIKNKTKAIIDVAGFLANNAVEIGELFNLGISAIHTGNRRLWKM